MTARALPHWTRPGSQGQGADTSALLRLSSRDQVVSADASRSSFPLVCSAVARTLAKGPMQQRRRR